MSQRVCTRFVIHMLIWISSEMFWIQKYKQSLGNHLKLSINPSTEHSKNQNNECWDKIFRHCSLWYNNDELTLLTGKSVHRQIDCLRMATEHKLDSNNFWIITRLVLFSILKHDYDEYSCQKTLLSVQVKHGNLLLAKLNAALSQTSQCSEAFQSSHLSSWKA